MTRVFAFPHVAAWVIVAALIGGIAAPQICGAHSRNAQVSAAPVTYPVVEVVPDDRPDRHGYDEYAFTDEMNHHPTAPPSRAGRRPNGATTLPGAVTSVGF
jgi:hypothetical protein